MLVLKQLHCHPHKVAARVVATTSDLSMRVKSFKVGLGVFQTDAHPFWYGGKL